MGKGQRHSKNAGTMGAEALTYHERRALGFGTIKERVGKDSHGNFYDCCLTLQPAVDPVVTPDGYLYSREALLENLLQQKKAIKRRLAQYEQQQADEARKAAEVAAVAQEAKVIAFDRQNHRGAGAATARAIHDAIAAEAATMHDGKGATSASNIRANEARAKQLRAFWVPSQTPAAKDLMDRPDTSTYCPASGKKLRLKDCVSVKFTRAPEYGGDAAAGDAAAAAGGGGVAGPGPSSSSSAAAAASGVAAAAAASGASPYVDPVTKDALTNASRLVVIAATGDVVLEETYKACIKPDGEFKGKRLKGSADGKDVIRLQTGGTGFAAHDGDKAQAQKHFALGAGSGRADLRGQNASAPSKFALRFSN